MEPDRVSRFEEEWVRTQGIVWFGARASNEMPAARRFTWIDASLPGGDRNRSGRHLRARRRASRQCEPIINARHVWKARHKSHDVQAISRRAVKFDYVRFTQARPRRHIGEVRSELPAITDIYIDSGANRWRSVGKIENE